MGNDGTVAATVAAGIASDGGRRKRIARKRKNGREKRSGPGKGGGIASLPTAVTSGTALPSGGVTEAREEGWVGGRVHCLG